MAHSSRSRDPKTDEPASAEVPVGHRDAEEDPSFDETPERDTAVPAYDIERFAREEDRKVSAPWKAAAAVDPADALRARFAPFDAVPKLTRPLSQMKDMIKDSKTAFIVGFIDGAVTLELIVHASGLPEEETLTIIAGLVDAGVVELSRG
jgi:hypothetical protein